jgi:hypothetical protein
VPLRVLVIKTEGWHRTAQVEFPIVFVAWLLLMPLTPVDNLEAESAEPTSGRNSFPKLS